MPIHYSSKKLPLSLLALVILAHEVSSSPQIECELFIAESTIPHAGYGVFSAIEKKPGDTIGNGDVALPLLVLDSGLLEGQDLGDPFEDYVWSGVTMGMGFESWNWEVVALWPGLDCAINSLIPLENVRRAFPSHSSHGDALPYLPHRSRDPGAGAITTYRAANTTVMKAIPAGGELFKSYGDSWFTSRPQFFDENFPLTDSFPQAQAILENYEAFHFPPLYDIILGIRETWKRTSRVMNALPVNEQDLKLALDKDITHIHQKNATRSLEWLRKHGTCVDHIVHKPSTISGAGEGAFAKRHLPEGTVITGTPLLHFMDGAFLDLAKVFEEDKDYSSSREDDEDGQPQLKQILYNYCFGHEETSLVFFPYAAVGALFINHGSGNKANVRVQWAKPGDLRHDPSSFELTPEQLGERISRPELGIEYIAVTDIEQGEELFLDYGDKWDETWNEHVKKWLPSSEDATIASDWNQDLVDVVRTKEEQLGNPYPASIGVRCHVDLLENETMWTNEWKRYGNHPSGELFDVYGLPCEILERSTDNSTYKVSIGTDKLTFRPIPWSQFGSDRKLIRRNVPSKAIFFRDATHKSDLFLMNAFRFSVQLPDEMVPDQWRNKRYPPTETRREEL